VTTVQSLHTFTVPLASAEGWSQPTTQNSLSLHERKNATLHAVFVMINCLAQSAKTRGHWWHQPCARSLVNYVFCLQRPTRKRRLWELGFKRRIINGLTYLNLQSGHSLCDYLMLYRHWKDNEKRLVFGCVLKTDGTVWWGKVLRHTILCMSDGNQKYPLTGSHV